MRSGRRVGGIMISSEYIVQLLMKHLLRRVPQHSFNNTEQEECETEYPRWWNDCQSYIPYCPSEPFKT